MLLDNEIDENTAEYEITKKTIDGKEDELTTGEIEKFEKNVVINYRKMKCKICGEKEDSYHKESIILTGGYCHDHSYLLDKE